MTLKSASEDLRQRTLDKIAGLWGKLTYIADRRSTDGRYQHWGFERTHGTVTAQETFARAHQSLLGIILRTRLSSLREDLEQASGAAGTSPASYVSQLTAGLHRLLPSGCPKMTELHLTSVLKTLLHLEARREADAQSSSPPPPLGRPPRRPEDS